MLFGIVLFALVLAIAYFHYAQGLFSATLSAIISVISALLAVSFYEPMAEKFFMGRFPDMGHAAAIIIIFAASYLILRLIFDAAIPGNVRVYPLLHSIGGGVMGLVAGIMAAGIVAIAAQSMPFGPNIMMWARYPTEDLQVTAMVRGQNTDAYVYDVLKKPRLSPEDESNIAILPVDRILLGLAGSVSDGGSMAGSQSFKQVHPDLLTAYFGQRIGIQPSAKHVAFNNDQQQQVKFEKVFMLTSVNQVPSETVRNVPVPERKTLTPGTGNVLVAARISFDINASDKDRLIRLSMGSVQLIAGGADGEARTAYYPIGVMYDGATMLGEAADGFLFANADAPIDLVFEVSEKALFLAREVNPETGKREIRPDVELVVKRGARFDLGKAGAEPAYVPPVQHGLVRREALQQQLNPPQSTGAQQPAALPSGAVPPGAVPPGAVPPAPGAMPPGAMPPGAVPPAR